MCTAASGVKSDFRYRRFVTFGTVHVFIGTDSGVTGSLACLLYLYDCALHVSSAC